MIFLERPRTFSQTSLLLYCRDFDSSSMYSKGTQTGKIFRQQKLSSVTFSLSNRGKMSCFFQISFVPFSESGHFNG